MKNLTDLAWWRMHNLGLFGEPFASPEDVVRWLGAVQAQEFGPSKWSIAHRTTGVDDAAMDRLVNEGRILRTHMLRPTWHFVLPEDIRLVLQVTGPRVQVANGSMYRNYGLDAAEFERCNQIIVDALRGGNHLTRKEIGEILASNGIEASGTRLASIMMNAELEAIICSGALNGKQHTYALIDERAPDAREFDDPEEALAEFVRRYFTSHGPATIKDLRAWSSMKIADIRRGIEMLGGELASFEFDGLTFWYVHGPPESRPDSPHALFLQGYDEYFMGYFESRHVADGARRLKTLHPDEMPANGTLVIDSQIAGHWRRTLKADQITFEVMHYEQFNPAEVRAIEERAELFGAFLGLDASVTFTRL